MELTTSEMWSFPNKMLLLLCTFWSRMSWQCFSKSMLLFILLNCSNEQQQQQQQPCIAPSFQKLCIEDTPVIIA